MRVVQSRVGSDGHGDQCRAARAGTACKSWVDHCRAILITDTSQAGEGLLSLFKRECQKKWPVHSGIKLKNVPGGNRRGIWRLAGRSDIVQASCKSCKIDKMHLSPPLSGLGMASP